MSGPPSPDPAAPAPAVGRVRLARVALLGLASWALGAGAHVAAGGSPPSWPLTLLVVVALGTVAVAVTGRRLGPANLLALLAAEQGALHWILSASSGPSCAVTGSHHDAALVCAPGAAMPMADDQRMVFAHAVATVLTAWLLARGEAWLWRAVRRLLALPVAKNPLVGPGTVVPQRSAVLQGRVAGPARSRGPPAYPAFSVLH